jgi:hypothetical protein
MDPAHQTAPHPAHRVLPWIALLVTSFTLAHIMNCALLGSAGMAEERPTIVATPAGTPDPGPSCTWIGAYCAFPAR